MYVYVVVLCVFVSYARIQNTRTCGTFKATHEWNGHGIQLTRTHAQNACIFHSEMLILSGAECVCLRCAGDALVHGVRAEALRLICNYVGFDMIPYYIL